MTEPKSINYIDIDLMEKMCHPLAVAIFDSKKEPIPSFAKHDREKLEAALHNPQYEYYPTFTKKASILYYGLAKGHCFENGNKRTATASLLVFLHINNFWLDGDKKEVEDYLVNLAQRLAASEGNKEMSSFLEEVERWLDSHIRHS